MLIKKSKIFKMLIMLVVTLALVSGIYFVMPKQSKTVSAATAGSSAVLKGYNSVTYDADGYISYSGSIWYYELKSPVSRKNVTSITITTDSSKITGYTKGENVADDSSLNELYYYYKLAGYQVDTNSDGTVDTDGYDIIIYADVETIFAPVCSYELFKKFSNCKSIDFENFDTSQITSMYGMFYGCSSLTSLDLSNFDTSQVTNMVCMFADCSSLTSLDLSNFNTSQVTDMNSMFYYCPSLTSLDLSNFNTSQVTDMSCMFTNCYSLTSLNVSNFDTSQVTDLSNMFYGCSSLTTLDISSFSFASIDTTDEEGGVFLMLGMSATQYGQMFGLEGDILDDFINAKTNEERVQILIDNGKISADEAEEYQLALSICITNLSKIIAPATIPSGLTISLPGEYNYTGGGDETTSILIAGATHTLPNASNDTSETGVVSTSILVGLIALCFVYSGFMMLKKKKIR